MSLLDTASLVITPNGTKASKLYSVVPSSGAGDMTVTRATTATRVNSAGLIESVASNVPRLDYSNGTCPSILVEPQRANLLTYSELFDNSAWTNENLTLTPNSIISPSGILNAYKMTDTSVVAGEFRIQQNKTTTLSTPYTATVFLKAGDSNFAMLRMYGGNLGLYYCVVVDLSNGTITKTQNGGLTSSLSYTITSCVNGWYKLTATSTMVSTNLFHIVHVSNSGTPSIGDYGQINYTGTGSNSIYAWGAQLEAGSYATSYIPTTSASVTRNADVINKTGISSLIGQTEGTVFFDTYIDNIANQTNEPVLFYLRGVAEVYIEITPTGRVYGVFYNGSTSTGFINANIGLQNGRHKMAFGYKDNDFVLYVDGTQVGTDTSGLVSGSLSEFGFQYYDNSLIGKQYINSASVWKTRLTNTQLQTLTTI